LELDDGLGARLGPALQAAWSVSGVVIVMATKPDVDGTDDAALE
jgi:hypothetical protein